MSISYPLSIPTVTGFRTWELVPRTVVGFTASQYTGEQQVFPWPGQWWSGHAELPPMKEPAAAQWAVFFLAMNGLEGTCYMGPSIRRVSGGNPAGAWTVGAGAVANSTVLPITGGTGAFAVGDWLQVGATTAMRLHRVLKVNASSVDVFPRLRSAYANGTAITYANAKGIWRILEIPTEAYDSRKICQGMNFSFIEAL